MYCSKCGNLINPGEKFCGNCGQAVNAAPVEPVVDNNVNTINGESIAPQAPVINNEVVTPVAPISVEQTPVVTPQPAPAPVSQPVVNPQPTYNNVNNNNNNKKNNSSVIIVIAVIIIAILVGCLVFVLNRKDDDNEPKPADNNTSVNDNTNTNTNNQVSDNSSNTLSFKDYTFTIPTGYMASNEIDHIEIVKNNLELGFYILATDASFATCKQQIAAVRNNLMQKYTTGEGQIKTYNGLEFILFEISDAAGNKALYFIASTPNSYQVFEGIISDEYNTYNYNSLNTLATIFKTAKYNSSSSFSKSDEQSSEDLSNLNVPDISIKKIEKK